MGYEGFERVVLFSSGRCNRNGVKGGGVKGHHGLQPMAKIMGELHVLRCGSRVLVSARSQYWYYSDYQNTLQCIS